MFDPLGRHVRRIIRAVDATPIESRHVDALKDGIGRGRRLEGSELGDAILRAEKYPLAPSFQQIGAILPAPDGSLLVQRIDDVDPVVLERQSGFGANDRPNVIGDPSVPSPGPDRWFNPNAFALPDFGTFGNAGRNSLEGPGYRNVNLALTRRVPLSRGTFQLRLEIYNAFNWTNFDQPDNFLGLPTFGQILSAGPARRLQLGLRYGW